MSDVTTTRPATPPAAQLPEVRSFPTLPNPASDPALQTPAVRPADNQAPAPNPRKTYSPIGYLLDIVRILILAALPFVIVWLLYRLGR